MKKRPRALSNCSPPCSSLVLSSLCPRVRALRPRTLRSSCVWLSSRRRLWSNSRNRRTRPWYQGKSSRSMIWRWCRARQWLTSRRKRLCSLWMWSLNRKSNSNCCMHIPVCCISSCNNSISGCKTCTSRTLPSLRSWNFLAPHMSRSIRSNRYNINSIKEATTLRNHSYLRKKSSNVWKV